MNRAVQDIFYDLYLTLNKQTFPVLSHAIRQLVLEVEMSFDLGNPVRTFTVFTSSTSHTRTVPSHEDVALVRQSTEQ